MAILSHEYWKKFIEKDKNGKEKGNGREFEKLVRYYLSMRKSVEVVSLKENWKHFNSQCII